MVNEEAYQSLSSYCSQHSVTLVAVSKTKPIEDIMALYHLGQRDFGENYVQELVEKQAVLPSDIRWHFIGHLQSNKVKQIASFVHLIHSVDSEKLLQEINKQSAKVGRSISCLLQMHIAQEETKYGMDENKLKAVILQKDKYNNVVIKGLMGMASFTQNTNQVVSEFQFLRKEFKQYFVSDNDILSMGMSGDYKLAVKEGSNLIRVGSLLFGARN